MSAQMNYAPGIGYRGGQHRLVPNVFPTSAEAKKWGEAYIKVCNLNGWAIVLPVQEPLDLPRRWPGDPFPDEPKDAA